MTTQLNWHLQEEHDMGASKRGGAISRRTALTGLGTAAITPGNTASVQGATADMADHPVVGLWQNAVTGTGGMPWTFSVYHADGTYHEWNGLKLGSALGIWRPTGERTADLVFIYQDTDPSAAESPGTVTFRMAITADATGNALTAMGDLDLRTPNGILVVAESNITWTSQRMTFDWNPATGSTGSVPPAATPTS
jgi:hypothetical protein